MKPWNIVFQVRFRSVAKSSLVDYLSIIHQPPRWIGYTKSTSWLGFIERFTIEFRIWHPNTSSSGAGTQAGSSAISDQQAILFDAHPQGTLPLKIPLPETSRLHPFLSWKQPRHQTGIFSTCLPSIAETSTYFAGALRLEFQMQLSVGVRLI